MPEKARKKYGQERTPNGWVCRINGVSGPNDRVPPEPIVGAWKTDAEGNIVGDFMPNPKYRPLGR